MSDARRKAEIEAKRAKLQELRQAREARKSILAADRESLKSESDRDERPNSRAQLDDLVSSLLAAPSSSASPSQPAYTPRDTASPSAYDSRSSQASEAAADTGIISSTRDNRSSGLAGPVPEFVDVERELFEITPAKPTLTYNKAVQTTQAIDVGVNNLHLDGTGPDQSTGGVSTSQPFQSQEQQQRTEAELRASILAELSLESNAAQIESDEQLLRGLSYDELQAVYASSDFAHFLESSSKVVQRALSDRYDYLRDYSLSASADDADNADSRHVRFVCAFEDERWTKNRAVTDVDWSYKFPELSLASYNKNPLAVSEPDGIVCVWNLHLRERPEFVFHSQSDVLSAIFSPFQPNTVIGGTYSGQILIWDTRAKHSPVLKTPLSASGHSHPVYSLDVVGTQNAHHLVSASTDGMVCTWLMDMPARPQETLELVYPSHAKTDEVSVTCLGAPDNETGTLFVGTEEGPVFAANRFDRAGAKAGLVNSEVYRGHSGPVTGLHFHPIRGPVDFGDLFLTSGVDWTVKLWRSRAGVDQSIPSSRKDGTGSGTVGSKTSATSTNVATSATSPSAAAANTSGTSGGASSLKGSSATNPASGSSSTTVPPLATFEGYDDYVFDVKWHPVHPAVFASVDGSGHFDIWNLNTDTEVPVVSTLVTPPNSRSNNNNNNNDSNTNNLPACGLNKIAWDRGGVMGSSGNLSKKPGQQEDTANRTSPGSKAAIGSSDGRLYIYDVSDTIVGSTDNDWDIFRKTCMTISQRGLDGTWNM